MEKTKKKETRSWIVLLVGFCLYGYTQGNCMGGPDCDDPNNCLPDQEDGGSLQGEEKTALEENIFFEENTADGETLPDYSDGGPEATFEEWSADLSSCIPKCLQGQKCGSNGCNGSCGPGCLSTEFCNAQGQCEIIVDPYTQDPVLAVDISHYSKVVSDNEMACFQSNGIQHVVVGLNDYYLGLRQIEKAMAASMSIDTYLFIYWNQDVATQVRNALDVTKDLPIRMFWLDIEDAFNTNLDSTQRIQATQAGLDECGEFPCGIYTAWGYWVDYMDNTTAFSSYPLWYAHYENVPNPTMSDWQPYPIPGSFGGWVQPQAKQYTDTYILCNVNLTQDIFYLDPIAADELHPLAPTGIQPANNSQQANGSVVLSVDELKDALEYEFDIWHFGGQWYESTAHYWLSAHEFSFEPVYPDTQYRF